jgi:hypothetical protein
MSKSPFDYANAVFASAADPRALRSWVLDAIIFCLAEASFIATAASAASGTLCLKRRNKTRS